MNIIKPLLPLAAIDYFYIGIFYLQDNYGTFTFFAFNDVGKL
jgi:hypothetical protein